jgi:hypothetical protein
MPHSGLNAAYTAPQGMPGLVLGNLNAEEKGFERKPSQPRTATGRSYRRILPREGFTGRLYARAHSLDTPSPGCLLSP